MIKASGEFQDIEVDLNIGSGGVQKAIGGEKWLL